MTLNDFLKFCNFFDLVTNCGTTEHIELQYEVFKNK